MSSGTEVPYDRFNDTKVDIEKEGYQACEGKVAKNPDAITTDELSKLKDFQDKYNHANFIRKVYTVVFLQLLNIASFVLLFLWNQDVNSWIVSHQYAVLLFGLLAMFTYSFHSCCRHYDWNFLNFLCFVLYTITEGLFIGSLMTFYSIDVILISTGITILLGLLLTIYAFKTESDYTECANNLVAIFILLVVFGTVAIILRDVLPILLLTTSVIGVCLFSAYVVHTTQRVSESYDVSSSVIIFVSLVNLFLFVTSAIQLFLMML